MTLIKRLAGFASALIVLVGVAFASEAWRVTQSSGAVRITQSAAGMHLVSTGDALSAGSVLSTGLDGRAVLERREQSIVVGPNSRMVLPAVEEEGMTRILQDLGTLMFKVDKRNKQHFRVETPVIAAVVKGTTFTVTAGDESHAVHVAEGLVEVIELKTLESTLVGAGETISVSIDDEARRAPSDERDDRKGAPGFKTLEEDKRASLHIPTNIGFEPIDYASLTDGLVRPAAPGAPVENSVALGVEANRLANAGDGVINATDASFTVDGDGVAANASVGDAADVGASVGDSGVDVGASVGDAADVGASVGDSGVDVGASVGDAADVGASVGDSGVDVGASVGDAADVGASVGDSGVDVGASVGDAADVGASVGDSGVDVGASVGDAADVGASVGDSGVDVGASVGDAADVGASVGGLDESGLDEGGLDVGLELDAGGAGLDLDLGDGDKPDPDSGLGGLFNP